ncbi:MAG: NADH-quinone oxidoreductase subunit F, partial [Oligoflexia bacterium]|nr:NADH-quinone oxidoreductase subunit F [Oligoflexia bacterium]
MKKICEQCTHDYETPCADYIECKTAGAKCQGGGTGEQALHPGKSNLTVYAGKGTCGLGSGVKKTIDAIRGYAEKNKIEMDIIDVGCIGLCSQEPVIDIKIPGRNRISFGRVSEDVAPSVIEELVVHNRVLPGHVLFQYKEDNETAWDGIPDFSEHEYFAQQTRRVLKNCGVIDPLSIEEYFTTGGYKAVSRVLKQHTPDEVCDIVLKSGLRGRGGGGFPTGQKWKYAAAKSSFQKYLICNADEGDPGAFMDRAVIEGDPHKLIEGIIIASYAISASRAYVYIRAEYPLAIERLTKAIEDAKDHGLLGYNILDSGYNLSITIKKGAGAFVCGEETALINSIEGKRGMPRTRPPYPAASGLHGCPTVINNVETLANLPGIILSGWESFAAIGTKNSKGTKVFALSGTLNNVGLVEVEMGTSIRKIIFDIGGGIYKNKKFKSAQIGGPSGGCITEKYLDIEVDYESLKTIDAMMGSGGLVVMDEDTCMVDVARFFMDFIQRESCGKCIPCREGTKRMLEILNQITRSRKSETGNEPLERFKGVLMLKRLAQVIQKTSLCGLGQTAPNPVLSTMKYFKDEYEAHIFERKCPAGVCEDL